MFCCCDCSAEMRNRLLPTPPSCMCWQPWYRVRFSLRYPYPGYACVQYRHRGQGAITTTHNQRMSRVSDQQISQFESHPSSCQIDVLRRHTYTFVHIETRLSLSLSLSLSHTHTHTHTQTPITCSKLPAAHTQSENYVLLAKFTQPDECKINYS